MNKTSECNVLEHLMQSPGQLIFFIEKKSIPFQKLYSLNVSKPADSRRLHAPRSKCWSKENFFFNFHFFYGEYLELSLPRRDVRLIEQHLNAIKYAVIPN